MTDATDALSALRDKIDQIDDEILDLLEARAGLGRKIAKVKALRDEEEGRPPSPLRLDPSREAAILRRILDRPREAATTRLLVRVWCELMGENLAVQGGLGVTVWGGRAPGDIVDHARQRFGSAARIGLVDRPEDALGSAEWPGMVSVLALEPTSVWWGKLLARPHLQVFSVLPDLAVQGPTAALAIGRVAPEPTGGDQTFWVTDAEMKPDALEDALGALGCPGQVIAQAGGLKLVALAGYVQAQDDRLARAPGRLTGVIGASPLPYDL